MRFYIEEMFQEVMHSFIHPLLCDHCARLFLDASSCSNWYVKASTLLEWFSFVMPEMKLTWVMEATKKYAKVAPIQIRRSQGKLRLLKLSTMSATYSPMNPNTAPLHPTTYPTSNYVYSGS